MHNYSVVIITYYYYIQLSLWISTAGSHNNSHPLASRQSNMRIFSHTRYIQIQLPLNYPYLIKLCSSTGGQIVPVRPQPNWLEGHWYTQASTSRRVLRHYLPCKFTERRLGRRGNFFFFFFYKYSSSMHRYVPVVHKHGSGFAGLNQVALTGNILTYF